MGHVETGHGFCTGTAISAVTVLTAAHCLFDAEGAPIPPEEITFRAGYRRGVSVADRPVARWVAAAGYRDGGGTPLDAAAIRNDVALLRLTHPLPRSEVTPIALHSGLLRDDVVRVLSYGQNQTQGLQAPRTCALTKRFADGVMEFDCAVGFGASGAPILAGRDGSLSILSLVSAIGSNDAGVKRAFGTSLPSHVAMLRNELSRAPEDDTGLRRLRAGDRGENGARFVRP